MKQAASIYEELVRIQESGKEAALCVLTQVHGSAPQIAGAKMVVLSTGEVIGTVGGGALEKKLTELALEVIRAGQPRTVRLSLGRDLGMTCGGEAEAYLEPVEGRGRLVIFGAGHIAQPMAGLGRMLGFHVTVVDARPEWATRERFPAADEVVVSDFAAFLEKRRFGPKDHVLIVTHGHAHDQLVLESVVKGEFAWLGMIGSKSKVATAFTKLRNAGVPEDVIRRIEAPVGFDLGAVSPEEIAVSIAARLVHFKRKGPEASGSVSLMHV